MKIWFTTIGWSPMAVVNTLWHYCREFTTFPDEICILFQDNPRTQQNLTNAKVWLEKLHERYASKNSPLTIKEIILPNENVEIYAQKINEYVGRAVQDGRHEIYLDMTPGRKYMSMIVGMYGMEHRGAVRAVYYNHLFDEALLDTPLPLIPRSEYAIYNMLEFDSLIKHASPLQRPTPPTSELGGLILDLVKTHPGLSKSKIRKALFGQNIAFNGEQLTKVLEDLVTSGKLTVDTSGDCPLYRSQ